MAKIKGVTIIDVDPANVEESGFFCYMSKRKSEGYLRKLAWVRARLDEGLRIKLLNLPDAVANLMKAAARKRITARVVELRTAREVQTLSPSPYGAFNVVLDGRLVGYHYLLEEDAAAAFGRRA